jgi:hypothetical protein
VRVWRDLPHERRLAALACAGLFLTLFLPWYQETVFANGVTTLRSASSSLTGWGAFSFVEAAVLLVGASVLVLLFVRAEGRAFHVPGGDGGLVTAAGLWTCALIVWRIFDKQGTSRQGQIAYTSGIEWGIFVALAVAALLAYAGSLIRLAHEPEPPLPGETGAEGGTATRATRRGWPRRGEEPPRRRAQRAYPGPDMEVDDNWTQELGVRREPSGPAPAQPPAPPPDVSEAPTRRVRPRSVGDPGSPPPGRNSRPLDRREIQELQLEEPPTARLGRSAAAQPAARPQTEPPEPEPEPPEPPTERQTRRGPDAGDDQLTIRLDRPG